MEEKGKIFLRITGRFFFLGENVAKVITQAVMVSKLGPPAEIQRCVCCMGEGKGRASPGGRGARFEFLFSSHGGKRWPKNLHPQTPQWIAESVLQTDDLHLYCNIGINDWRHSKILKRFKSETEKVAFYDIDLDLGRRLHLYEMPNG